jgi:hypothetical protein
MDEDAEEVEDEVSAVEDGEEVEFGGLGFEDDVVHLLEEIGDIF